MPTIGEIQRDRDIGYSNHSQFYQWIICPKCNKERWVKVSHTKQPNYTGLCHSCAAPQFGLFNYNPLKADRHWSWKGGRRMDWYGYYKIRLYPDNPFYPMVDKQGYVMEHRLIVAKAIGRCLEKWEIVHHLGTKYPQRSRENRSDNRYPENLQLETDGQHKQLTILEHMVEELRAEVKRLELLLTQNNIKFKHFGTR